MEETRLASRHVARFAAEDFTNYRDGRVREDAVSVVLFARIPNPVSDIFNLDGISDLSRFKHAVYVDASTLSSIEADLQAWARMRGDGRERDTL
jgi:hypothetical protein